MNSTEVQNILVKVKQLRRNVVGTKKDGTKFSGFPKYSEGTGMWLLYPDVRSEGDPLTVYLNDITAIEIL